MDNTAEQARADSAPLASAPDPGLCGALLDSRQRWRDFATLAADLVFETDGEGRFTFVAPEAPLGWAADALLGRLGRELLAVPEPDPFALHGPARGLQVWLRRPDGGSACLSLSLAPLHDSAGRFVGLRGSGRDISAEMAQAATQAAALRRAEALQTLVSRVRREVLAPRMLTATLEALESALGCAGAAVLEWAEADEEIAARGVAELPPRDVVEIPPRDVVEISPRDVVATHHRGADPAALLPVVAGLADSGGPAFLDGPAGERLALVPQRPPGQPQHALLAWRAAGQRSFDADDRHMLVALSDLLFVVLGNQALQQRLERQARTDALTGLLNRGAFLEDLGRRLRRQAMDPLRAGRAEGALVFLDLDNFKPINDRLGHEAGDAALVAVARLLREMIRPTDLVARLGGDEFALWLEEADAEGAAIRAAGLCAATASFEAWLQDGTPPLTFSIGCAIRHPGTAETPEALLARADAAMYGAKRGGRNHWVLAAPDEPPRRLTRRGDPPRRLAS